MTNHSGSTGLTLLLQVLVGAALLWNPVQVSSFLATAGTNQNRHPTLDRAPPHYSWYYARSSLIKPRPHRVNHFQHQRIKDWPGADLGMSSDDTIDKGLCLSTSKRNIGYMLSLISTVTSWTVIAYLGLSKHPTPAIQASTSIRHNCFTIAQALAFPVPVLTATFLALQRLPSASATARQLNLGTAMTCLWTAAAITFGPTFSVGYDLFSTYPWMVRHGLPLSQLLVALFCLSNWWSVMTFTRVSSALSSVFYGCIDSFYALLSPLCGLSMTTTEQDGNSNTTNDNQPRNKALGYALATKGLFLLALLPQLVGFPTATIPTLLGKRLSRTASGFTFLGGVASYCLFKETSNAVSTTSSIGGDKTKEDNGVEIATSKTILRRGLGLGATLHIGLVWAKLIGFDGGGLLLPGCGLWKDYPSLVNASGAATTLMIVTYTLLACLGL